MTDSASASRLSWLDEDIIVLREWPAPTPESIQAMFGEVMRMATAAGRERFVLLADLSESERPSAEVRHAVRSCVIAHKARLAHVAMFTGGFLISVAAKFIFGGMVVPMSTHAHREDAEAAVRRAAEKMRSSSRASRAA